ncbi:hypothetical protein FRB99_007167, partial [Tulasnella sp. 403]
HVPRSPFFGEGTIDKIADVLKGNVARALAKLDENGLVALEHTDLVALAKDALKRGEGPAFDAMDPEYRRIVKIRFSQEGPPPEDLIHNHGLDDDLSSSFVNIDSGEGYISSGLDIAEGQVTDKDLKIMRAYAAAGSRDAQAWLQAYVNAVNNPDVTQEIGNFLQSLERQPSTWRKAAPYLVAGTAIVTTGTLLDLLIGADGGGSVESGSFLSDKNKKIVTDYMQEHPDQKAQLLSDIKTQKGMSPGEIKYFEGVAKGEVSQQERSISDLD